MKFRVGDRVTVTNPIGKYERRYLGETGTVQFRYMGVFGNEFIYEVNFGYSICNFVERELILYSEAELKTPRFNIGDVVKVERIRDSQDRELVNKTGSVCGIFKRSLSFPPFLYEVLLEDGKTWDLWEDQLGLVEKTETKKDVTEAYNKLKGQVCEESQQAIKEIIEGLGGSVKTESVYDYNKPKTGQVRSCLSGSTNVLVVNDIYKRSVHRVLYVKSSKIPEMVGKVGSFMDVKKWPIIIANSLEEYYRQDYADKEA